MKNFKRLMAVVLAVVMLSTVAFAAAPDGLKKNNYAVSVNAATIAQGATEFTFDIVFKDITGESVDFDPSMSGDSGIGMTLTDEAIEAGIEITSATSEIVSLVDFDTDGAYFWTQLESDSVVKLTADTVLCSVTCSIPADVAVGTYKVLKGNTYDYAELIDASGESTSVIKWADDLAIVTVEAGSTAEDISVAVEDAAYTAVKGATDTYTGVWVGSIEKELEGKTMTAAKLVFGDNVNTKDLAVDSAIGGNGSVAFKIAVLGVPRVEGTMTPAYDAAVVLTVE